MATRVQNLDRLKKKLEAMPPAIRSAIRQALAESADDMVAMMKRRAPVGPVSGQGRKIGLRPGALRDSIVQTWGGGKVAYASLSGHGSAARGAVSSEAVAGDADLSVRISAGNTRVRYAHLVEFGTAPHPQSGQFKGSRHPGTAADPFFFPSYRALRKPTRSRITRSIRKSIKCIAAGT